MLIDDGEDKQKYAEDQIDDHRILLFAVHLNSRYRQCRSRSFPEWFCRLWSAC
jgi:hypothetical protein